MKILNSPKSAILAGTVLILASETLAQGADSSSGGSLLWVFLVGLIVALAIGAVVTWKFNQKDAERENQGQSGDKESASSNPGERASDSSPSRRGSSKQAEEARMNESLNGANPSLQGIDLDDVKVKMEKIRFERLPINRIEELRSPRPFTALPPGEEEELLKALEESDVEFVEDEEVRDAALDVLAGSRTRNSVDAIAQMAIYDISATLRSKAVGILADIDHESVFESVILSCADPSREVRAAGAKALFKLSFNRTDAWLRLFECEDTYRISQAAKAAIEADFVGRSLERLVHKDVAYASEALALIALLIKAGETDELLDYLVRGEKRDVKLALLRVFRIVESEEVVGKLKEIAETGGISEEIIEEVRKLTENGAPAPA
ncbi:MAG: hypothetical protein DWQ47_01730 [Acidobacteria bacterium]|nr:MAG: hypothetical protein DWQ32_05280 [Acidobacteriota bacterium]REK01145.1 MAG: hypothetical protein DWQ38_01715 [Acidobacteriota bacterium]REK14101.1 MAG: hypothetical protein DWQ43_10970 [Acidobacteriota bacterium]REK44816.1 MAG: hypothetical protein DWQ47_01730 [Acidobacteriota bacterium]